MKYKTVKRNRWINMPIDDAYCVIYPSGGKTWFVNGKAHREDGPALILYNGDKLWRLDGKEYSKQDYYRELVKRGLMTEEDALLELI